MTDATEPGSAVERFWQGFRSRDALAIINSIADREDVIVIGTDESEYWIGRSSLVKPFKAMVAAFHEEHVRWADADPVVRINGDAAWVVGRISVTVVIGSTSVVSDMRATFVLERSREAWEIVHAHFSVPPAQPVVGY